jgi:hypothetical protein
MSAQSGTISLPARRVGSRGWRFAIVVGAMIASAGAGALTGRITAPSVDQTVSPAVQRVSNPSVQIQAPSDSPAEVHGRQIAR